MLKKEKLTDKFCQLEKLTEFLSDLMGEFLAIENSTIYTGKGHSWSARAY